MTARRLRLASFGVAALVFAVGAAFPAVAAYRVGATVAASGWVDAGLAALIPALALVVLTRYARDHRLALWAALVGGALTLALGLALYAAALGPDARPGAAALAVSFVPLRQLVAVAFAAWAASLARRTGDG